VAMKVVFHDRTEMGAARLRSYAERRLDKLTRHFERGLDAEVTFEPESKSRQGLDALKCVQILVHMDGRKKPLLKVEEKGHDLRSALDLALDRVDRQVVKVKDRIVDRHKGRPFAAELDEGLDGPRSLASEPERVKQAVHAESIEQAAAKLDANGAGFHLFLDEDSGDLQVVYRRPDGSLVVVEPLIK
jgi:putative sigma-54 modulation protein